MAPGRRKGILEFNFNPNSYPSSLNDVETFGGHFEADGGPS